MNTPPAQCRMVDARLAKSDEDIKHGRVYGPFNTAEEMAASIESNINEVTGRAVRCGCFGWFSSGAASGVD